MQLDITYQNTDKTCPYCGAWMRYERKQNGLFSLECLNELCGFGVQSPAGKHLLFAYFDELAKEIRKDASVSLESLAKIL